MMHLRHISLAGSALATLLLPVSAAAYITPEQVLLQDAFINNFTPPPTTRTTGNAVAQQAETSRERREREQAEYFASQRAGTDDETLYGAAPEEDMEEPGLAGVLSSLEKTLQGLQNEQAATQSARDQRLLDRIAAQQAAQAATEILRSGAPLDQFSTGKGTDGKGTDGKGGYVNSGAPLNESGPASWAALALICAALWYTLRRAKDVATVAVMDQQA